MKITKISIAALALATALAAQVAQQANSGYQTEAARKSVAKSLADPAREQAHHVLQKFGAVGVLPPRVLVAEVLADVAHGGSAEQGVHHGVKHGVRVAVTRQALIVRNLHAAQQQRPPWRKAM